MPGEPTELYVRSRRALLDALAALEQQLEALVLVGAQAIYLHTGDVDEAIATETKDSDLVIDPDRLLNDPQLERALLAAGFKRNLETGQPGEWLSVDGIPVDLLVPAGVAPGNPKRRGVDLPPHDHKATRRVSGLEAALVDHERLSITALERGDEREFTLAVAGPAALLVAKLQKITDRQSETERRRIVKDGHDVYRLLREIPTATLVVGFQRLIASDVSRDHARGAARQLQALFGSPRAPGARMAGTAVARVGQSAIVSEASVVLAVDLLGALQPLLR